MNIVSLSLTRYVELGVLLVLAYPLLRILRTSVHRLGLRIDSAALSRMGRMLLVVTLFSPFVGHWLLSLPGGTHEPSPGAVGSATSVDGLAEHLRGLSGMLTSQLVRPEVTRLRALLEQLDPALVRTTGLFLAVALLAGLVITLRNAVRHIRDLREVVRAAVPLRMLGRVSIVVSDRVAVPFSTAIFGRAHVVVPVALLRDPCLLRVAVRHELQHYRRRDPMWAVVLELFRILYFWNPAARGWTRELADLQELACDEAVIRRGVTPGDYGSCLLIVAEMAVAKRFVASTAMATISDRGARLRRRIDMLFRNDEKRTSRSWAVGLALVCSLLLIVAATATAANSPGDAPKLDRISADSETEETTAARGRECPDEDCTPVEDGEVAETLPDLEFWRPSGETVTLSSLDGKVVLVSFWAAWCKFCQAEVENLKALHEEAAGTDFEMVGVSFSRDREEFEEFIAEHEVTWPQMHADDGWRSEAGLAFGVKAVPTYFLIDRDGTVTALPRGNPELVVKLVQEALRGRRITYAR